MKAFSKKMTASLFFRITGCLCIVLLSLILCLAGTLFVGYIVGLLFSKYFL